MRYTHPLAYVAAFLWPVLAVAVSYGQVTDPSPGAAPNVGIATTAPAAVAADPAPAPASARVAVLPFIATNPQAGNAWIGKSIQQSLSADLLQAAPSRVQTADAAANTSADAVAAGRQLGVNYVVFGTYSSTDQAIRIVGQVVDVSSGSAVSSLKATGKLGDVFLLEDDLSHQARIAMFGQAPADNGPGYTVHEVPDNSAAQTYTPPNGGATYVNSSTGYAYPAQSQDSSMQYGQTYISSATPNVYYSYPAYNYYSYPYYSYGYPYYGYGYGYPGLFFGFSFSNGGHYHYGNGGGYHYGGGGGGYHGGGYSGGGMHSGGGGMGHGGGGHR